MPKHVIFVVDDPGDWNLWEGAEIVSARDYLTQPRFMEMRSIHLFNLCSSYRYQSLGYYVSLLAAARGHKPLPSVRAVHDLKSPTIIRLVSEELDDLIQRSLKPIRSSEFVLSIYFGSNLAKRYDQLSLRLFKHFQSPFLQARFVHSNKGRWVLHSLSPIGASNIPEEHRAFVEQRALEYFGGPQRRIRKNRCRYDLAILIDRAAKSAPSNARALKQFARAASKVGFDVTMIDRDDIGRLAEFDALFIRETTNVNHHTYRFARRAAAEGLVVIDDPQSIVLCTNKVFLAELLQKNGVPAPKSLMLHRGNADEVLEALGLPCVLKEPDGSFSKGVIKVTTLEEFHKSVEELMRKSELLIAQEFLPTDFDWRIGVFNRHPIFASRYYMVKKHWQIIKHTDEGKSELGKFATLPIEEVPKGVVRAALRAANLIGNGLYGVDLKQVGDKVYVIEVNDNPNIDGGVEDQVAKEGLYLTIMEEMMRRVEVAKGARR
ncbi:MAG: RimK family protein [Verrucomicrobia bacterium]|nr:RimK family protein [Verrucomicrobiota bacterium]